MIAARVNTQKRQLRVRLSGYSSTMAPSRIVRHLSIVAASFSLCDNQCRSARPADNLTKMRKHLFSCLRVEIAGGFVSQKNAGGICHGPRNSDTLLFAPDKVPGLCDWRSCSPTIVSSCSARCSASWRARPFNICGIMTFSIAENSASNR